MIRPDKRTEPSAAPETGTVANLNLRPHRPTAEPTTETTLQELHVHKAELETQNEQLRRAQAGLEKARNRYLDLYQFAPVGYLILTNGGHIADINHTGTHLLGMNREDILHRPFEEFVLSDDAERWEQLFDEVANTDQLLVQQMRLRSGRGNECFLAQVGCRRKDVIDDMRGAIRLVIIDLSAEGAAAEKQQLTAAHADIRDDRLANDDARTRQLAFLDPLTNLPNRRLMADRLRHAMATASRTRKKCAVLFVDLDNFKALNDSLGHDAGDQLLQHVAQRLVSCVRSGDTVARHGGDEFVVILENLSDSATESVGQVMVIGEKIVSALNQPYPLCEQEYASSASIGAALFDNPHDTPEELLKRADLAMYEAKAAGRNALRFFDPAMQAMVAAKAAMATELRRALERHELQCYFQPQLDKARHIVGAEVLLRWQHPERGLMLPGSFLGVIEETGQLAAAVGEWVLETACRQGKAWANGGQEDGLQLAVNISARQFRQPDFVDNVRTALEKSAIDPARLTLEFNEKNLLADPDGGTAKMESLKRLGVRLAIHDFGIGNPSLSQIAQLPIDQLKIDRSLVQEIGRNPTEETIVQTLINVGRQLGMEILAEGVETKTQYDFLGRHGCHAFQGNLLGKPLPAREFEKLMGDRRRRQGRNKGRP